MTNQLTVEAIIKCRKMLQEQKEPSFASGFYVPPSYLEAWIESGDAKKVNGQWTVNKYPVFTDTAWEEGNQEKK